MAACQNLLIRFTTASFPSQTADASVGTAKKLISARSSQDKPWESKKSKKVFGWSALWSTISATSIWRKKLCSLSTTLLAQKWNLCLRHEPELDGAESGSGTHDLSITNRLLYH